MTDHQPTLEVVSVPARNPEIGSLLGMLEIGTRNMRHALGEIDEDTLIWQAHTNGHSVGALLIHVAACEAGWLHWVAAGHEMEEDIETSLMEGRPIDQYAGLWPVPPNKPLSWYYEKHDEIRTRTLALIGQLTDPNEVRSIPWRPERTCSVRWILHHVIEHEAYHLGQAVLLTLLKEKSCQDSRNG